jgi:hypothetical protein
MKTINVLFRDPHIQSIVVWLGLGVLVGIFFALYSNFAQDDAYITYRYARNLSLGLGFVYNRGEHILGTTTPLYTLILAAGAYVTKLDVTEISTFVCFVSLWVSAGILFEMGKSRSKLFALSLALVFTSNPFLRYFVGMESLFLVALLLLTVWAHGNDKRMLSAIVSGLLIITRYEMIFFLMLVCVGDFLATRKLPLRYLVGNVPVVVWLVFAHLSFGSAIPLSVSAKLTAPRVPFLVGAAVYWYQISREIVLIHVVLVFLCVGILVLPRKRDTRREYALILIWSIVYLVVGAIWAGSFPWYYAPLIPGFALLTSIGLDYVSAFPSNLERFARASLRARRLAKFLLMCGVTLVVGIQFGFWIRDYALYRGQVFDSRYVPYRQVAEWLKAHATRDQAITAYEIGYIGYLTDMRVIDLAGLVTPALHPWIEQGREATLIHALRIYAPDYVLVPSDNTEQIDILGQDARYTLERAFANTQFLYRKR